MAFEDIITIICCSSLAPKTIMYLGPLIARIFAPLVGTKCMYVRMYVCYELTTKASRILCDSTRYATHWAICLPCNFQPVGNSIAIVVEARHLQLKNVLIKCRVHPYHYIC